MSGLSVTATFYLVVKAPPTQYRESTVRVTKKAPTLDRDEIPVHMTLRLPMSLFKRPQLNATIEIPDDSAPPVIDASVQDNIAAVLREQLGVEVTITVPPADGQAS